MQIIPMALGAVFGGGGAAAGVGGVAADAAAITAGNAATWGTTAALVTTGTDAAAIAGTAGAGFTAIDALGYGGMALSGVSGYMQQQASNKAAEFNANAANQEANQTIEQGRIAEQASRIKTAQTIGQERSGAASAGVDANIGTPLQQQQTTAQFGEFDALTTRYNAMQKAQALQTQAAAYQSSEISPILAGATSTLSSGVSFLGNKATRKMYENSPYGAGIP